MKWHLRLLICASIVVSALVCLAAQTATGALGGVVTDWLGLPLPGVTVTLEGSGVTVPRETVTVSSGAYHFDGVPSGTYKVSFALGTTVRPHVREGIKMTPGVQATLNVALAWAANVRSDHAELRPAPTLADGEEFVRLETSFGNIDIAVDTKHAPITAANFLKYVDGGFYDGGEFNRTTRPDNYTVALPNRPMMELIQARVNPVKSRDGFPAIPLERTSVTGLKHVAGTVSMARTPAADSATSAFFILLDDQPSLDFAGKRFDDAQGAAAFGRVVAGLDVVRKIQQQPAQGQNLTPPVTILLAARPSR